ERGPENGEIAIRAILTPAERLSIICFQSIARFAARCFGGLFQPLFDAGAGKLFKGDSAKCGRDHRIDDLARDVSKLTALQCSQVIVARIQYCVLTASRDNPR